MPFSSKKTKKQRRHRSRESNDSDRTLRPKLNDFKRRTAGDQSKESATNARNTRDMTKRGGLGEKARALRTRHVNSIFDNFRNSIESMLDPSFSSWGYFPSSSRLEMKEGVRTPVYDMVDEGDRYKLIVELPGIEKNNIHISAMDDSIEISAEQSEEDKQKRNFVYNQRRYSSFYCTIPFPEEILSSEVTAKTDSNGILRVELPKKTKPQDIKSRTITVE